MDLQAILALIPEGSEWDILRWTIKRVAATWPSVTFSEARVKRWVAGIKNGDYTAESKRSDILEHMVGQQAIMDAYGIDAAAAQKVISGETSMRSLATGDYTDDEKTFYTGLPGKPEIWKKGKTWYAVYYIPGTEPPIPILYRIPTWNEVKSFFGGQTPVANRVVTDADIRDAGGIVMGTTDNIPEEDGDPWAGFIERMDRAAETQPWLNDPEVFALHAAAWLEGREVEQHELEGTAWWQSQNVRQRDWAWTVMRDPEEAKQRMEDRIAAVILSLAELGLVLDDNVVNYIAQQVEMGHWSITKGLEQIQAIAGGANSQYELDTGLADVIGGADVATSTFGTQNVIDLYLEWLGPAMGQVSEADAAKWATKIRELGDVAREELVAQLKQSRLALFPEYSDESMTYRQIAAPWKNFASNIWGQTIDESSEMFLQILRANDSGEAGKILRRAGLEQGISKVGETMELDSLGAEGSVRRAAI